ncbi:YceD family protein [Methylopila henanensis]|uniref:YceD family protein n=1 Tax=Methylopila henanensis TaxID=873516 RepID=A0ABW4K1K5_9HYPH
MSANPLSRPIKVETLPPEGLEVEVVATEEERAALAAENDIPSIERLVAHLRLRPVAADGVAVDGRLTAALTRVCVVTLEPFETTVDEPIDLRFAPESHLPQPHPGEEVEIGASDPPDPYVNGKIDLGAVVAEFFVLGLDPYPRKPGAAFALDAGAGDATSPFAALSRLKPADKGE